MPVNRPPAPIRAIAALFDELPAFLAGPDYGSAGNLVSQTSAGAALRLPSPGHLGLPSGGSALTAIPDFKPLQVFVLSPQQVRQGQGLSAAAPAGWRFYLEDSTSHATVMAWVSERKPGVWKMAAAFFGAGVTEALRLSLTLDTFVAPSSSYESRMLIVPALNLEAFWLRSQTGGIDDMLVPFPHFSAQPIMGLNTQPAYKEPQFLNGLRADILRWQTTVPKSGG